MVAIMSGVKSILWRCPRCYRINGWTSRTKRPKKRIDTNCSACKYRVRFTPIRQDIESKSYGSEGRGRKSTVDDYRIFNHWYSNGQISEMARDWNTIELAKWREKYEDSKGSFRTFNFVTKEWIRFNPENKK